MKRSGRLVFFSVCFIQGYALVARAGPDDASTPGEQEKQEARNLFLEGVELFNDKDYEGALERFELSFETFPHWSTRFNIGLCHFHLKNCIDAIVELLAFIGEADESVDPEQVSKAEKFIESARLEIFTISFLGIDESDEIEIDGQVPVLSPDKQEIFLNEGSHEITIYRDGEVVFNEKITGSKGENTKIKVYVKKQIEFKEAEEPIPAQPEEPVDKHEEDGKDKDGKRKLKTAGWVLAGMAAAALVTGSITGGLVKNEKDAIGDLEKKYRSAPGPERPSIVAKAGDHYEKGLRLANTANALFAIGGALAAGGVALLIMEKRMEKHHGKAGNIFIGFSPCSMNLTARF